MQSSSSPDSIPDLDDEGFRALIEHAPSVIALVTPGGRFRYVSPAVRRLLGFEPAELIGADALQLIPPDGREELIARFGQIASEPGSTDVIEHRYLHKDGREVWLESRITNLLHDPHVGAIVSNFRDISERRAARAERRLREQQANLNAAIGAALTSREPLAEQLQQCAEALTHHYDAALARIWTIDDRREALVLQASAGLLSHISGDFSRIPFGRYKAGRIAAEQRPHISRSVVDDPETGDRAWAEQEGIRSFVGYPLLVGTRLVGVLGVFSREELSDAMADILSAVASWIALGIDRAWAEASRENVLEAERQARAEAEEAAGRLAILNGIGQLLAAELDVERIVQAVTDAATELTGAQFGAFFYNVTDDRGERYTLYTLAGASQADFAAFPMPRATQIFGPTFRGEGIVRLGDIRKDPRYGHSEPYFGLPPGHLPVVSYLAVPVIDRQSGVLGGLFFGHGQPSIFDERAEELAAGLAAYTAVALDNAALFHAERRARAEAEGAVRARDLFLSSASHDLKTPLAAIGASAQLLRRRVQRSAVGSVPASDSTLSTVLRAIEANVERMAGMIDELLDVARLQIGQQLDLRLRDIDLVQLGRSVMSEHQARAPLHHLRLESETPSLHAVVDPSRIERVLSNLVGNAIKYSPDGGEVVLSIECRPPPATGAERAILTVTDHGIGIPTADLPRLFEPFFRAGNALDRVAGSGVGLAGSRQIVLQHGGELHAQSTEGEGSVFTVILPLTPAQTPLETA